MTAKIGIHHLQSNLKKYRARYCLDRCLIQKTIKLQRLTQTFWPMTKFSVSLQDTMLRSLRERDARLQRKYLLLPSAGHACLFKTYETCLHVEFDLDLEQSHVISMTDAATRVYSVYRHLLVLRRGNVVSTTALSCIHFTEKEKSWSISLDASNSYKLQMHRIGSSHGR